jgi:hypothetical protein
MTQEKLDFDLESLVAYLRIHGTKASAATHDKLTKASAATLAERGRSFDLTDADRRDMLYFRQAGALAAAVEELKTWLGLLDRLYCPQPLDYRLHVLFEALASTAVLARRCIDDDVADQILNREQKCLGAAHAREGVSEKVQPRDKLLLEVAKEIRVMKPKLLPWGVAGEALKNKRLTESTEWEAKPLKQGGVNAIVTKHWSRLAPSLSLSKRTSRR